MIQKVVLSEQVKEVLLDDILSGRYEPGDRLVESKIARDMGISQSPVREALRDLVAMRFVEVVPHKGARVRRITRREVLEIYPVRAALEDLAGTLAVGGAPTLIEELEHHLAHMSEALAESDARRLAHVDMEFHRAIMVSTGNEILIETWNSLMIEARTLVTLRTLLETKPDIDIVARHHPIIDALRAGDPVACGKSMRVHVEEFGLVMGKILGSEDDGDCRSDSTVDTLIKQVG